MVFWLMLTTLWLAILSGVTFLLIRQLGFVLQRVGPVGARSTDDGPRIGESIAAQFPSAVSNQEKASLVVFVSEHCAMCKLVREAAERLAQSWGHESSIYLIYDCSQKEMDNQLKVVARGLGVMKDPELRGRLGIQSVPFAVVTNCRGVIVGKGMVNGISHLESLLEVEKVKRQSAAEDVDKLMASEGDADLSIS